MVALALDPLLPNSLLGSKLEWKESCSYVAS
jgi:hypothetical protein